MTRRRVSCRTVMIDGQPVVVRGDREPTRADLDALTELTRAVRAHAANTPELCREPYGPARIPCTREPGHDPPHRTRSGREW